MTPRDKNSTEQYQNTTERNRMSLKSRIYLIAGGFIVTFVGGAVTTVVVLQRLGFISGNSSIPLSSPTISSTPSPTPSTPSPTPSTPSPSSSTPSLSPSASTSSSFPLQTFSDVTWELKKCERKQNDVSCSFSLITTSERKQYDFWLNNTTKMTDHEGHEYFSSKGTFVDNKAGAGSNISHEMQKGSTYAVSIDFTKIPTSISEMNSLIVGNQVKFDDVSIK